MNLHSKKDFQDCMLSILEPLKLYYSEEKARLTLGVTMAHYDIGATWMEAFSRPLWGLVPFWAGGGKEPEFEEIYRKGLTAGTDEKNPEYWGECTSFDQRFVEMAAISYGIMFAPEVVWDPLTEAQKENLCNYLNKINEHPLPVCNWILFAVLVNIAMKKVGRRYSPEMLEEYLEGLETFYLGEGWYQDGDSGQKDYYISFAIHFYSLIYAVIMEKDDPERAKKYKARAMEFAKQFIYWFDEEGEAIPFGISGPADNEPADDRSLCSGCSDRIGYGLFGSYVKRISIYSIRIAAVYLNRSGIQCNIIHCYCQVHRSGHSPPLSVCRGNGVFTGI